MNKLDLRTVTLVCVETRCHELIRMAIDDCLAVADFGRVLVFTDDFTLFSTGGFDLVKVEDWPEKIGWSRCFWHDVPKYLETPHTLNIQWDSWIVAAHRWRKEFLDYDYIGAPWWFDDGLNVGNGGFCFRSRRLLEFLWQRNDRFPITTSNDDALICRTYRPQIERESDLRWAPDEIARDFSFECPTEVITNTERRWARPVPDISSFGFHAMHNWAFVLDEDALVKRTRLALANKYIRDTRMPGQLFSFAPWLPAMIGAQPA